MLQLSQKEIRALKGRAQRLKATFKVGKQGISPEFTAALDEALRHHELIKLRFDDHKEQKHELAAQLAERTASALITIVGHVAVLYRPRAAEGLADS
jgi:RNA-binding protein